MSIIETVNQKKKKYLLSIIIPCYNEEKFISSCIESIEKNTYPVDNIEILILDGESTDHTRDVIRDIQKKKKHLHVKLIDNPGRNKAKALNIGIQQAHGDIVMRMDAHAVYDKNYIAECVNALNMYGVENVGGVRETLPGDTSIIAKSIAYSLGNKFAVGNSIYRTGIDVVTETDIVFLFCCRKELFNRIGFFDERLVRGQDREFNLRLKKYGCKMLLIPTARSYYYARSSLKKFVHWIFVGGMVPVMISRLAGENLFSLRNFIPPIFLLTLLSLAVLSMLNRHLFFLFYSVLGGYVIMALFFAYPIVKKEHDFRYFFSMPLVFLTTHIAYGAGFIAGFFKKFTKDPCV